jgi:putative spermidine/putrescine transport system substrate-binding protein
MVLCALAPMLVCGPALRAQGKNNGATGQGEAGTAHGTKPVAQHGPTLSVASLGGGLQAAQQAILFAPFTHETGEPVRLDSWDGTLATLQHRAQSGSEDWDLVLMEDGPVRIACREGLLVSDPRTADPANTAPDSSGQDCGVAAWQMNLVLAWDKSRVDMAPTWADFWDVARRPGKRGLRRDPRGTLEIALMADGVAPDEVYRTLATSDGVDRAFRKLDQLKPYIVWWNKPAETVQIVESGAVLMTSAPSGEIATANQDGRRNFGTQWAQSLGAALDWAVLRTTVPEHRAAAQRLLAFVTDPARQAAFLSGYAAAPADAHQRATLMMDDAFWADHLVPLRQRFDAWLDGK